MIKELVKIANKLDNIGLTKEADELDSIIRKMSGRSGYSMTDEGELEYPDEEALVQSDAPQWHGSKKKVDISQYEPVIGLSMGNPSIPNDWYWMKTSPEQAKFEESMIPMGDKDIVDEESLHHYGKDALKEINNRLQEIEKREEQLRQERVRAIKDKKEVERLQALRAKK